VRDWESAIEKAIREAQERGEFDNLANAGKPLNLEPNPYAPDLDLVHHLLKEQGFAPEWIEEDKMIRQVYADAVAQVQQAWRRYQERRLGAELLPAVRCQQEQRSAALAWTAARQRFADQVTTLNQQIRLFNLKVPIVDKQRAELDVDAELHKLGIDPTAGAGTPPLPNENTDETAGTADGERGRLQEALYRLIQGREKMPLSPPWHNARRATIFRYIDRLQHIGGSPAEPPADET
jgi:hypothetical protein